MFVFESAHVWVVLYHSKRRISTFTKQSQHFRLPTKPWRHNWILCLHFYLGIALKSTIFAQSWIPKRNSFTVTLFQISSTTLCYFSIFEPFGPGWKAMTFKSCFQHFSKKWDRFRVEWVIDSLFCLANTPKIWPLIALDPVPWLGGACQQELPSVGGVLALLQTWSNPPSGDKCCSISL